MRIGPKYKITRLQDKCEFCGKVAKEIDFGEWLQNAWRNITGRVIAFLSGER